MGSCLGSCLGSMACGCCDKMCGGCRSKTGSLIPYMILFIISSVVALILKYYGKPLLLHLYIKDITICDSSVCMGIGAVDRITFALALFFLFHGLFLRFQACKRLDFQNWWLKIFIFFVLLISSWFIPDAFYDNAYRNIARVVSGLFLLIQLLILVDFAYTWNEDWTSDAKQYFKSILGLSFLFQAIGFVSMVLDFIHFGSSGCKLNQFFISFTLILTTIATLISISPWLEEGGGLLPASVVALNSYWLLFDALTSDPSECNTVGTKSLELIPLFVGLVLNTCAMSYAAWSVSSSSSFFGSDEYNEDIHTDHDMLHDRESQSSGASSSSASYHKEEDSSSLQHSSKDKDDDDDDDDHVKVPVTRGHALRSSRFHLLMCAASMYQCMLLTSWGSRQAAEYNNESDKESIAYSLSEESMWIKMSTQWIGLAIFIWSLIAPKVCPNRDFS